MDELINDLMSVINHVEQKIKDAGIANNEPKYKRKISYLLTKKVLKELLKEIEDEYNRPSD